MACLPAVVQRHGIGGGRVRDATAHEDIPCRKEMTLAKRLVVLAAAMLTVIVAACTAPHSVSKPVQADRLLFGVYESTSPGLTRSWPSLRGLPVSVRPLSAITVSGGWGSKQVSRKKRTATARKCSFKCSPGKSPARQFHRGHGQLPSSVCGRGKSVQVSGHPQLRAGNEW